MARSSGLDSSQHAITDVYDAQGGFFLVHYPNWLVITLGATGVLAFGVAGFLGYEKTSLFYKPWAMYFWVSALILTLLASIFRHRALRGQLITVMIIGALCVILAYLIGDPTGRIRKLLEEYLPLLAKEQVTYVIINFGLLLVFWIDTFRRWGRRARGMRPHAVIDIMTGQKTETADPEELPSMAELVSGDLIAATVLASLLAFIFQRVVMSFITQTPLNDCSVSVSFPPSGCVGGTTNVMASLTLIDQTQALAYLAVGMIILAVAATMGGLGAVGGAPMPAGVSREVYAAVSNGNPAVTVPVTVGVAETIVDALRAAINRRLREFFFSIIRALRNVAWPVLLFTAMLGVYQFSDSVQKYLHLNPKTFTKGLPFIIPATAWGVVSILTVVFAAALVVFKWRVVDNTMRFLGLIGLILLLTIWIFSLAMYAFNYLLEYLFNSATLTMPKPFDPPLFVTIISFGALLVVGGYLAISRRGLNFMPRQAARSQPPSTSVPSADPTKPLPKSSQE